MSQQERVSWVSLISTLVIGVWYFSAVFALPPGTNLHGGGMASFVTRLIVAAIFLGIAGEILLRWAQRSMAGGDTPDATAQDERDVLIDLKATRNGSTVMTIGIILVLSQIALLEFMRGGPRVPATVLDQILTGPLSALHVAQLLLLVLTLSGATVYASRIFCYRRGY